MSADRDLRTELVAALKVLEGFQVSTEPSIEEVEDPESEPPILGDPVKLYLAASHDRDIEMTVERVLATVAELQEGSLVETEMLAGSNWAIVRVVGGNDRAEHFCRTINYHDVEDRFFECKHEDVHLYLQGGVNALPFHYSKMGIAEEIFPEFGNDELYVFLRCSSPQLKIADVPMLVEAYLFEIERTSGMLLRIEGFPVFDADELSWMDEKARDSLGKVAGMRLRPLLVGSGLDEVLALFNDACGLERHPDHLLLGFVRVIEHVSVTAVRLHAYQQVRARLLSERALDPDAAFIDELQRLVEALERKRSDKEAIKETVRTCCDVVELAKEAPPFLTGLKSLSSSSSTQVKEQAANTIAHALYATRNAVAHAKANYVPTGQECPIEELDQFAELARRAAAQAIRWLGTVDSRYRA